MGDIFKEQLIKKQSSRKDRALKVLIIFGAAVLALASFLIPVLMAFAPILAAGVIFLAYYLNSMLNIEYEYILTNSELDIDCIYSKSRRKHIFSANVKDFEVMAHVEDKEHIRDFDSAEVVKDYSSGRVTENTYAFLYNYNGKRTKFIFEPNDTILKALCTVMSRRKLFVRTNAGKPEASQNTN